MSEFQAGLATGIIIMSVVVAFSAWLGLRRYNRDFNSLWEDIEDGGE